MTVDDQPVIDDLRSVLAAADHDRDVDRAYEFRPDTWRPWLRSNAAATFIVDNHQAAVPEIGRADLASLSAAVDESDDDSYVRLFVATMIWGSGIRNGRGPRYTAMALGDDRLLKSLKTSRRLVLDGNQADAYTVFRSRGVGPAFFTKWFWAAGLDRGLDPAPLILDARVWASLGALGWDSRAAAETTRRAKRYVAYLEAMERWSASLSGVDTAEHLEQVMFNWAGGR